MIITATISSILLVAVISTDLFLTASNTISDALYQSPKPANSEIIIIGMDEKAEERFGTMPWSRDVVAQAIEYLNQDPKKRPAVIGLDTLFVGESDDANADERLADVAGEHDNVVAATSATFGTQVIVEENGDFYTDTYSVIVYEQPYDSLLEQVDLGHVNAMIDQDGIMRHAVWQIELQDGTLVPSFNKTIYEKYQEFHNQEASSVPTTDSRYRWYVPFQSLPFGFDDGYSVTQLFDKELDPDLFAGKIVLIGPYAQGMYDEYTTSIDHAVKMFGVEYQANLIAALLEGELKTELLQFPQTVLTFVAMFLLSLWFYDRKFVSATVMWLATSIGWVVLCTMAYDAGYVIQAVNIPLASTIGYLTSVAINYARAAVEKRRVTKTFSRYVAPEIVSELLNGDPKAMELGGRLVDIAVLFVDIRGFTTMSEKLPPSDVVEIVNQYLTLTSRCIFENEGTLDKYVGDCTMAFWGAPIKQQDSAFKAVKAALDMVDGAKDLGMQLEQKYGQTVQFGIGITYGAAVVGNIGSATRMDYTAIGDTVNTAARLESNAPAGCIYVGPEIATALEGRVRFSSLGSDIKLKGKSENFEIFKVEEIVEK